MAELLGNRKRGRRKEKLRTTAQSIAETLATLGNRSAIDVEIVFGNTTDTVSLSVPKGVAVIPADLTAAKTDENVRQQLRNAIADAGVEAEVRSVVVKCDVKGQDFGTERTLWAIALHGADDLDKAKPRPKRK